MSYQQTGTPRESVPQNNQGNGETTPLYTTVSDSRDEELSVSAGRLNRFLQLHLPKDDREFTEKLEKFVTFSSWIFVRKELNACPK